MHSSAGKTIAVVVVSMMAASIVSGCQETGYAEHTGKTSESSFKAGSSAVSERSDSRTSALNSSVISESSALPSEETDGEEVSEDGTLTVSAVILSESFAQEAIQIVRYPDSDEMLFRVDGMDEEFRVNVVSNASAASALKRISNALSTVSEDG